MAPYCVHSYSHMSVSRWRKAALAGRVNRGPDLQRRAVLRERGAEEGVDGVKDHVDDVFLQDGVRKMFFTFVAHLQKDNNNNKKSKKKKT